MVTIRRGAQTTLPLASVEIESEGRRQRIWSTARKARNATHVGAFVGSTVMVLGDGGTLFMADAAGPLVALKRVLCPKAARRESPARRLLVLGDVLAASMEMLPEHAPAKSVQYPQVREAAHKFAAMGRLFARPIARPASAVGELWFQLPEDYRLKVEATAQGVLMVGLFGPAGPVPGVEWTLSGRNLIHFVRPTGGLRGGPRYFMRGISMEDLIGKTLPGRSSHVQRARVVECVRSLGGRRPKSLEVKRR